MLGAEARRRLNEAVLGWAARGWRRVGGSLPLARRVFAVDFLPLADGDVYFDVTTPLLVRAARRRLGRGSRLLDMGTGAYGVVGLALWRQTGCHVVASDIHPRILEQARANVALNRAPVRVVCSRFFDDLDEEFDVVAFNPPYVPSRLAEDPTFARPFDFQSNGGTDGTSVVAQFLDAFAAQGGAATACLAINGLFVSAVRARALVRTHRDLVLRGVERIFGLPLHVFVIGRAG